MAEGERRVQGDSGGMGAFHSPEWWTNFNNNQYSAYKNLWGEGVVTGQAPDGTIIWGKLTPADIAEYVNHSLLGGTMSKGYKTQLIDTATKILEANPTVSTGDMIRYLDRNVFTPGSLVDDPHGSSQLSDFMTQTFPALMLAAVTGANGALAFAPAAAAPATAGATSAGTSSTVGGALATAGSEIPTMVVTAPVASGLGGTAVGGAIAGGTVGAGLGAGVPSSPPAPSGEIPTMVVTTPPATAGTGSLGEAITGGLIGAGTAGGPIGQPPGPGDVINNPGAGDLPPTQQPPAEPPPTDAPPTPAPTDGGLPDWRSIWEELQKWKDQIPQVVLGGGDGGGVINVPIPGTGGHDPNTDTDQPDVTVPIPIGGGGGSSTPTPQTPQFPNVQVVGANGPRQGGLPYDPSRFKLGTMVAGNAMVPANNLARLGQLLTGGN